MKIFGLRPQTDTHIEVDLDEEWVLPSALPYSKVKFTNILYFIIVIVPCKYTCTYTMLLHETCNTCILHQITHFTG